MDDIAQLKHNIDKKLDKEEKNINLLRQYLNCYSSNTSGMVNILNSFEERLENLEKTIVPVYNETENLRRRQENIEKTMHTLDNVLSYYHTAKDVEATIKEGPAACDLETYMSYLDKVLKARKYFENYRPNSSELKDIERIFEDGKDALQHEFRSLLNRHGRAVPAVVLLDLLNSDEELPPVGTDTDLAVDHLPESIINDLKEITKWLTEHGRSTNFIRSYTIARSTMLSQSLAGLKEHLKSTSGSSSNTFNTSQLSFGSQSSPAGGGKFRGNKDVPARKSMKKLVNFTKKASSLVKLEQGHRRQGSYPDISKEESSDLEMEVYINELSALLRLMQSEAHLMRGIIPEKHQRLAFGDIIQQALESVVNEGECLASTARKNVSKHEYTAVLSIFPIVQHLRTVKPEFDLILEGCPAPVRAKLTSLLSKLDSTGAKALEEFTDSIRNDPDKNSNMPRDGTVHELTNHTIIFLQQLLEYAETAGAMLLMHGEKATPSAQINHENCRNMAADYMTRVLSGLGLNLSNKAETYSDPALRPVFMLNNINYIIKSLGRSGLLELLRLWNKDIAKYYNDQLMEQKSDYSESWSKALHYILEIDKPMSQLRAQNLDAVKLKDKERQNIKDKFTGFNKELEEIYRVQKMYAIPDIDLRATLIKDNKDYMVPRYTIFYNKYSQLNFTKNRVKYIKYEPGDVVALLDKFFDASA